MRRPSLPGIALLFLCGLFLMSALLGLVSFLQTGFIEGLITCIVSILITIPLFFINIKRTNKAKTRREQGHKERSDALIQESADKQFELAISISPQGFLFSVLTVILVLPLCVGFYSIGKIGLANIALFFVLLGLLACFVHILSLFRPSAEVSHAGISSPLFGLVRWDEIRYIDLAPISQGGAASLRIELLTPQSHWPRFHPLIKWLHVLPDWITDKRSVLIVIGKSKEPAPVILALCQHLWREHALDLADPFLFASQKLDMPSERDTPEIFKQKARAHQEFMNRWQTTWVEASVQRHRAWRKQFLFQLIGTIVAILLLATIALL